MQRRKTLSNGLVNGGIVKNKAKAIEILKNMGFKITLISYQKMNQLEKGNPDCLYGLKRFLRTPDFDMNEII